MLLAGCWSAILWAALPEALAPVPRPRIEALAVDDQGQIDRAHDHLERLLGQSATKADLAEAYGELGALYLLYDLMAAAQPALENARALAPQRFDWHYYLAVLYSREGDLTRATESLVRCTQLRPSDLTTRIRLGRVLLARLMVGEAESEFEMALEIAPDSAAALAGIGQAALEREDAPRAVEHFHSALERQPDATALHHQLGLAYRKLGDHTAAVSHLKQNTYRPVEFPDPLMDRLSSRLQSARAYLKRGNRAAAEGRLDAALSDYRRGVEADPEDALLRYNLALALVRSGASSDALKHLRAAIEIDPDYRDAHFNLGALLSEQGDLAGAVHHLERAHAIDSSDATAHLQLARGLLALGRRAEGIQELRAVVDAATLQPRVAADAAVDLGRALAQEGDLPAAAQEYLRAVDLAPEKAEARFGAAMAMLLAGDDAAALRVLEAGVRELSGEIGLTHALARLLATSTASRVRNGERALLLAQSVFREQPSLDHAETLAMAYAETGDFESAVHWQREVVQRAQASGDADRVAVAQSRLTQYQQDQPVRAPWIGESH